MYYNKSDVVQDYTVMLAKYKYFSPSTFHFLSFVWVTKNSFKKKKKKRYVYYLIRHLISVFTIILLSIWHPISHAC